MQQVLFHIPILKDWFPDGIPIYGFGAMLFVCFIVCTWFMSRRAEKYGIPRERIQDMTIFLFVFGIIGARITYMIQYQRPIWEFFQIWQGGIVFYGSAIGGFIGYRIFYRMVLVKYGVSTWQLADVVAPTLALGLAIGRIGCFLNGCCYGHVACPAQPAVHFPLLSSPARDVLISREGLQTSIGFSILERDRFSDPRVVVDQIEVGSAASEIGLQKGDRIVGINGQPNYLLLEITDRKDAIPNLEALLQQSGIPTTRVDDQKDAMTIRASFDSRKKFQELQPQLRKNGSPLLVLAPIDQLTALVNNWPRGLQSLTLQVQRGAETITLPPFTPRTIGLYPTQLYESISMLILFALLITLYPLRPHDGFLFVVLMVGYAIHRFVNEQLRNDTDPVAFGMTLSQCISILILLAAFFLEFCLVTRIGKALMVWLDRREFALWESFATIFSGRARTPVVDQARKEQPKKNPDVIE